MQGKKLNLRAAIAALPFVKETKTGLDYWAVEPLGRLSADMETGRVYAAMFVHLMRVFDAPHLFYHVSTARHRKANPDDYVRIGFLRELWQAVTHAPGDATPTMQMQAMDRLPDDEAAAIRSLQFIRGRADGSLYLRYSPSSGNYGDDCARGRYLAAKVARLVQKFKSSELPMLLARRDRNLDVKAAEGINVGFCHEFAEVAIAVGEQGTRNLRAALPLFRDALADA